MSSNYNHTDTLLRRKFDTENSPQLRCLEEFLSEPAWQRGKGMKDTNFFNVMTGKSYCIPLDSTTEFFTLYDACCKARLAMRFAEKQNPEASGLMVDLDVYQAGPERDITRRCIKEICAEVVGAMHEMFEVETKDFSVCVMQKPKVLQVKGEQNTYKDGLHLIIPNVMLSRPEKRMFLRHLRTRDTWLDLMGQYISVAPGHELVDILDLNSASVPLFLLGSSSKPGSPPYRLEGVHQISVSATGNLFAQGMDIPDGAVMSHELSVNYCREAEHDGIHTVVYGAAIRAEFAPLLKVAETEVQDLLNNGQDAHFGELSILRMTDVSAGIVEDILSILSQERCDDYQMWRDVVFAVANTSASYRFLALTFSMRSSKFDQAGFDTLWESAVSTETDNPRTLGSLYHWAKEDNEVAYMKIRQQDVYQLVYDLVFNGYGMGRLQHGDVAKLMHHILHTKWRVSSPEGSDILYWYEFVTEQKGARVGELFKWRKWTNPNFVPPLRRFIGQQLMNLTGHMLQRLRGMMDDEDDKIKRKYYSRLLDNFRNSMGQLRNSGFIAGVMSMMRDEFYVRDFAMHLDEDPMIMGVANGVLLMGPRPQLVTDYHTYPVSRYTKAPYIEFNPRDPITRDIMMGIRDMFTDDVPDTHDYLMHYMSSTLDGRPKESIMLLLEGDGANGKSILIEMLRTAIGEQYAVKLPLTLLTAERRDADSASPALAMLKDAHFAYYSESNQGAKLNMAAIKEMTGGETLAARRLHENIMNFKSNCHHLVSTNNQFTINDTSHGAQRRIKLVRIPVVFRRKDDPKYRENDKYQKLLVDNPALARHSDSEYSGRFLGILVWYYRSLMTKYGGKVNNVPHLNIAADTQAFMTRQNQAMCYVRERLVFSQTLENLGLPLDEQKDVGMAAALATGTDSGGIIPVDVDSDSDAEDTTTATTAPTTSTLVIEVPADKYEHLGAICTNYRGWVTDRDHSASITSMMAETAMRGVLMDYMDQDPKVRPRLRLGYTLLLKPEDIEDEQRRVMPPLQFSRSGLVPSQTPEQYYTKMVREYDQIMLMDEHAVDEVKSKSPHSARVEPQTSHLVEASTTYHDARARAMREYNIKDRWVGIVAADAKDTGDFVANAAAELESTDGEDQDPAQDGSSSGVENRRPVAVTNSRRLARKRRRERSQKNATATGFGDDVVTIAFGSGSD